MFHQLDASGETVRFDDGQTYIAEIGPGEDARKVALRLAQRIHFRADPGSFHRRIGPEDYDSRLVPYWALEE